jgi:hypothetical protein
MKRIWMAGIVLGASVAVWNLVYGSLGLYSDPRTAWTFTVVAILIEVGVLVWGLSGTAKDGRRYWGQVGAGLLICLVAVAIIVPASMLFTGVLFPAYFDELAAMQAESWAGAGLSDEEIDALLERSAFTRTPVVAALLGAIGTMVTGLIVSLITAAFVRTKD